MRYCFRVESRVSLNRIQYIYRERARQRVSESLGNLHPPSGRLFSQPR